MDIRARRHLRVGCREISAACARVIAGDFEFELAGFVVCKAAQHNHPIFEWCQRLQDRRDRITLADGRRRPPVHDDPVGDGQKGEPRGL